MEKQMNEELKDKVLSKVKKMLNLANDSGAAEGERDNALRMAHAMLAKHNLSLGEAESHGGKKEDRLRDTIETKSYPWMRRAAFAVGELFFCKYYVSVFDRGQKAKHYFIGLESNVVTAKEISAYVIASIVKEANALKKDHPEPNKFWLSFCKGAADALWWRCAALRKEAEQASAVAPTMSSGTALVLSSLYASEKVANDHFLATVLDVKLKEGKNRERRAGEGYREGSAFGNKVSLNRQVGGAPSNSKRITA
jgi:hypothetical protein